LRTTLHTARYLAHLLNKTDVFSHVAVTVDQARDALASSNDVDLVFTTKERGRLYLNSSTELGNNEGTAVRTFSWLPSFLTDIRAPLVASETSLEAQKPSKLMSPLAQKHVGLSVHPSLRQSPATSTLPLNSLHTVSSVT
jgi:hypothetical protein